MAFVIEDGSGVEGANSYLSVAGADAWHADRNQSGWTGTATVKQAALILATDYIETEYTWDTGNKLDADQGLGWPRDGALDKDGFEIDTDEVPKAVTDATAYLALEFVDGELRPALERALKRVKADPTEIEWVEGSKEETRYPYVTKVLRGLIGATGSVELRLL